MAVIFGFGEFSASLGWGVIPDILGDSFYPYFWSTDPHYEHASDCR